MLNQSIFVSNTYKFNWNRLPMPFLKKECNLEGEFLIQVENKCKSKKIILVKNILGCYTKKGSIKWVNYENSIIESIHDKILGDGICLTKGQKIILYGDSEIFFNFMKMWCVQMKFFSQYKLLEKVGKGNQAEVFRCKYINSDEIFAVKIYQKHTLIKKEDRQALIKEISLLRNAQSENIIRLDEVFENDDNIFVVMELLEGGDLQTFLYQNPSDLTEKQIARFIYQLLKCIYHMNKYGIMHRDIKPKNIILRKQNLQQFCIVDFGLADFYNKEGKYLFQRCGTPGFVAPEVLRDEYYDFKVDVFSIGVIMYIMLTGEEPFSGDYNETIIKNYSGYVDVSQVKVSDQGRDFLKSLLEPRELRVSVKEALTNQWFKQEKIVRENYRIKVSEINLKQYDFIPQNKEIKFTSQQFLKPLRTATTSRHSNYRLSPISFPKKTPNPSPTPNLKDVKRKSLR